MLPRVSHASRLGLNYLKVRRVDTHFVVFDVLFVQLLQPETALWVAIGIAAELGPARPHALTMFQELTGCDTV